MSVAESNFVLLQKRTNFHSSTSVDFSESNHSEKKNQSLLYNAGHITVELFISDCNKE